MSYTWAYIIYIYIYRERERECVCVYTLHHYIRVYICIFICIYDHICICVHGQKYTICMLYASSCMCTLNSYYTDSCSASDTGVTCCHMTRKAQPFHWVLQRDIAGARSDRPSRGQTKMSTATRSPCDAQQSCKHLLNIRQLTGHMSWEKFRTILSDLVTTIPNWQSKKAKTLQIFQARKGHMPAADIQVKMRLNKSDTVQKAEEEEAAPYRNVKCPFGVWTRM